MPLLDVMNMLEGARIMEHKISVALMYSGLRIPQFRALTIIDRHGKITVTELSRALNVTRATASILVNELIKSNSVISVENDTDRRSFYIMVSVSGQHKLSTASRDIAVVQNNISEHMSEELIDVVNEFAKNIKWTNR